MMDIENQKVEPEQSGTLEQQGATEKKPFYKRGLFKVVVVALLVLVVIYIGLGIFFQTHFAFGTSIDGIKVGAQSVIGVEQLITEEIDGYSIEVVEREDKTEVISGKDIALRPVFNGEVEGLLNQQNGFAWIITLFTGQDLELAKVVNFDEDALETVVKGLDAMQKSNQRKPVDAACSEYSSAGYELVPADYGTTLKESQTKQAISDAILVLSESVDLDANACYQEPEIGDDNKKLLALIDEMNQYVDTVITYDFDVDTEILDASVISEWLSIDDSLKAVIDEEAVLTYVKDLAREYNTAYKPKTLATSYGSTITISGGAYGWKIDNAGEVAQILEDLKTGGEIDREPVYTQRANSRGENDYGDSYVEINLTSQHLFVYQNGELVIESDFVSGNLAKGHATPTGAFGLTYKTTNAVLRGPDYETPVNYWMPFNGDVGMHDLTSRRAFGGDIYKTNGSHGCINLPLSAAKTIYATVEQGFPVLVYHLPGTDSEAVKQRAANTIINTINTIGQVTLDSAPVIASARAMYDALDATTKTYVTNYDVLVAAEAALVVLQTPVAEPAPVTDPAPVTEPVADPNAVTQ